MMSVVVRPGDHLFVPVTNNLADYEIGKGERWLADEMPGVTVTFIKDVTCGAFVYRADDADYEFRGRRRGA